MQTFDMVLRRMRANLHPRKILIYEIILKLSKNVLFE